MIYSTTQTNPTFAGGESNTPSFSILDTDTPADEVERHLPQLRDLARTAFPNYPYQAFFEKDAFRSSLRDGQHLSLVAKRGGHVIGHNAIVRDRWAGVRNPQNPDHAFEMGRAMVSPSERGRGVGGLLAQRRHDIVTERYNPVALYSDCATGHDVSIRALAHAGYQPLGLFLGIWDDTFAIGQRESALVMASIESVDSSEPRRVFVPREAEDLAREVYALHGIPRDIVAINSSELRLVEETSFFVRQNPIARSVEILVSQMGSDIAGVVQNFIDGGAQSVVVHVKMNSESVYFASAQLSALGFIPGLVWPEFGVDEKGDPYDVLSLQYLSPQARLRFTGSHIQAPAGGPELIKNLVLRFL